MITNAYHLVADDTDTIFRFTSSGPKGKIEKLIQLAPIDLLQEGYALGPTATPTTRDHVCNLGFGDYDAQSDEVSDQARSNNGDLDEVLATVAKATHAFCRRYPWCWVFATGSTPSRTRLYQIGLNRFYAAIVEKFRIFGYRENEWVPFEPRVDYEAFLVLLK